MQMDYSKSSSSEYCIPEVVVYPSLGMVYPPRQIWRDLYDADVGLERGTIFRELDKPWYGDKYKTGDYSV
jgi:hypothetical protein